MKLGPAYFKNKKAEFISKFSYEEISEKHLVDGVNMFENTMVWRQNKQLKIYDRLCDHNGGRLISNQGKTVCPLHGWEFNPKSGSYLNVNCTKEPIYVGEVESGELLQVPIETKKRALENFNRNVDFEIRFLNHACLLFSLGGLKFATDPWIFGSAFSNGWWLQSPSPSDSIEELNSCDFIYVSHNHPDHLHIETLNKLRKDIPIVTANFKSGSTKGLLKGLNFKTVKPINFDEKWVSEEFSVALSLLKSGDFRDDSGLLIEIGKRTVLLTVDCNFLDFWRFPDKLDVLASSFAGGSSGFPLCFETLSELEKGRILTRNRRAIYATNKIILQKTKPKVFLPYAGSFLERAERDRYIAEKNTKNSIQEYDELCRKLKVKLVDTKKNPVIKFENDKIRYLPYHGKFLQEDLPEVIISKDEKLINFDEKKIIDYLVNSNFQSNLDLVLLATDPTFKFTQAQFSVEFSQNSTPKVTSGPVYERRKGINFLQLKVRSTELAKIVTLGLPWEDLSIGFQCRIYREPDVYNSEFWHHFTNIYVSENVKRSARECNNCEVLNQRIY